MYASSFIFNKFDCSFHAVVMLIFIGINFHGFYENQFQGNILWPMILLIQMNMFWTSMNITFCWSNQQQNSQKNWYSTNIDITTVCFYHSTALSTDKCPFCTASCPSSKLNPMDIKHTSMSSTLCKYTRHLHRLHIVANPPLHTPYME